MCKYPIPDDLVKAAAGRIFSASRKAKSGGRNGGRPKLPRCHCGKMTQRKADRDGHVCKPPEWLRLLHLGDRCETKQG